MLATLLLPDSTPCQLSFESWGDAQSTRILFCVHGLTRNAMDFEKLAIAAAAQGFRVIAPDMPGRGKSPNLANPALYNNAVNANLCVQLLAQLGITQVSWLGTSMGGIMALLVANQAPLLIQKLILNDVGCMIPASALKRIGEYVGQSPAFATFAEAENLLRLRTQTFDIPETDWKHFAENSIQHTAEGFRLAYDPQIALAFSTGAPITDIELWPLWKAVKRIPTLLIRGEKSDLLLEGTAVQMQATHPNLTRYNVAGAGHAPALLTQAEISEVLGFLSRPMPGIAGSAHHFSLRSLQVQWKKFSSLIHRHWS